MTVPLLVNIDVDDLERAIAFYSDGLGLRLARRFGPGAAEMLGAAVPVYLLEKPAGSPAFSRSAQLRDFDRHWTPVHLDVVVPRHPGRARKGRKPRARGSGAKSGPTPGATSRCSRTRSGTAFA